MLAFICGWYAPEGMMNMTEKPNFNIVWYGETIVHIYIYMHTRILVCVYIYYTWYKLHTIWFTIYIYTSKAGINQAFLMVSGLTIALLTLYTCLRKSTGVRNDQGVLQMVATPQFHLAGEKTKRDVRRLPQKLIINYNIIVTWTIITMYNGI